jgi:hypothetical protein
VIVIIAISYPFIQDMLEQSAVFGRSFSRIRNLVITDMRGSWLLVLAGLAVDDDLSTVLAGMSGLSQPRIIA